VLPLIETGRDVGSEAVIVTDLAVLLLGRGGGGGGMLAMICVDECTVASAFYIGCGRCWFAPRHTPEAEVYVPLVGSTSWRPKVVVVE
jgi:hypothetical protein